MNHNRRSFFQKSLVAALSLSPVGRLWATPEEAGEQVQNVEVSFPELPYKPGALEPAIDAQTMEIHYGKHFRGYFEKFQRGLDALVRSKQELPALRSVEDVLRNLQYVEPTELSEGLRQNGGGFYNHALFWQVMAPTEAAGEPGGALLKAIERDFGSLDDFQHAFSEAAGGIFGSGWAWLILTPKGRLAVTGTPNQDNPLMEGLVPEAEIGHPLLALDVWEHAYYLHYQNQRSAYIKNWWTLVNWQEVSRRYEVLTQPQAKGQDGEG